MAPRQSPIPKEPLAINMAARQALAKLRGSWEAGPFGSQGFGSRGWETERRSAGFYGPGPAWRLGSCLIQPEGGLSGGQFQKVFLARTAF